MNVSLITSKEQVVYLLQTKRDWSCHSGQGDIFVCISLEMKNVIIVMRKSRAN